MNNQMKSVAHRMQLTELLLAMALGMIVAGAALELIHRVWRDTNATCKQVAVIQETVLIRQAWQQFVHASPLPFEATAAGALANLHAGARVTEDGRLLLTTGDSERLLRLPTKSKTTLTTERAPEGTLLAVLTLQWQDRENDRKYQRSRRIVAAMTQPET